MITLAQVITAIYELVPEQYAQGMTTAQLHKQWGLSTWKITELVKAAGVYEPNRKPGAPLQRKCKRQHDQKKHRKYDKHGNPYCGKCKQIRQRVT